MWDERYRSADYVYGTAPNEFLRSVADRIPRGKVLSLGEGEGRNAVFLAELGCEVIGVDQSPVGLEKARRLAELRGVKIDTAVADLAQYEIAPGNWDAIVSIFCHLPSELRRTLYRKVVQGLRPGGLFVLEAYTPAQLQFKTGGPTSADFLASLGVLKGELQGLNFALGQELERPVVEGQFHTGLAAVVQILARKPSH
ncbi:MAG TPA: class I SAM-dependent methyltransferase [Candidatus Acidoferrum sp.]|nr:class I SAM-dependent methyltransferase [Candidatus Acidoferrum sp.]